MVDANKDYMVEVAAGQEFEKRATRPRSSSTRSRAVPAGVRDHRGSDFGQDAVKKARGVCERARAAIAAKDVRQLPETTEALTRTLNMFKAWSPRPRPGNRLCPKAAITGRGGVMPIRWKSTTPSLRVGSRI